MFYKNINYTNTGYVTTIKPRRHMLMLTVAVALKIAERITLVPEIVMHLYATNCLN